MAGYADSLYGVTPYGGNGGNSTDLTLAGSVGAVTGSFTVTVLARMDLAGTVPAVSGSFTVNVFARMDLAGAVPGVTGSFSLGFQDQIMSLSGVVPQPTGSFTATVLARMDLAGTVPPVTGAFSLYPREDITLTGTVPPVTGSFTILPDGEVLTLSGSVGRVRGRFNIETGYIGTVTTNRVGGLDITGTLPLEFSPNVAPVPASFARKRVIAAAAFNNVDVTGTTATYDTITETHNRQRLRIVIGGKDVTHLNGAESSITYQLLSPLLYGPATVTVPGVKTPFRRVGRGALSWCREFATVKAQLVNANDVVTATVYKGLIQAWNIDGTDLTIQVGGEASGRAAMRRKPLPVYAQRHRVGTIAYSLITSMGLSFKPFLGPEDPATTLEKVGGMWTIDAIEYVCRMTQKRDGTQFSIMPDADGDYRFQPKDTSTVDATVYVDGTRVRANVRRDMAEEQNRVFATAVTPEGRRLSGITAPGIVQGTPPAFPGTVLSEGGGGDGVVVLINRLQVFGYLDRRDYLGGFDADVTEAVKDLQEDADLPVTGVVDAATWNALFSLDVTGFSLRFADREPAAQQSRVRRWSRTPDGSIIAKNPNYDPRVPKVDVDLDMGSSVSPRTRRRWARAELHGAQVETWAGTLEVTTGAVIAGEHNPGDPLTAADLMDFRLLKPGMNIWCPGFQSETGTLFHISGVDADGKTLLVDTKARDTLHVWDVVQRQREERRWRNGRRASGELKDTVGEWDGAAGGLLYQDVDLAVGWNVIPVVAGQEGTVSRIKLTTSPPAEYYVAIFGQKVTAEAIDRRLGDPSTNAGHANWDDKDKRGWLRERNLLVKWGENPAGKDENPCGYDPKSKANGGTLTGEFRDDAGFAYRTEKFPVLYMAVWADRATTIPAGRVMWNQLEPGA